MTTRRRLVGWLAVFFYLLVMGAIVLAAVIGDQEAIEDVVSERLGYTSVHVTPGAEGILDADRARRIVGDRPIVVVAERHFTGTTCYKVADALPGLIVLMVSGEDAWPVADCDGASRYYNVTLLTATLRAATFADVGRDRTPYVEEYVRVFDAHVAATFPGVPPPRRDPVPPADDDWLNGDRAVVLIASGAMVIAFLVVLWFLIREVWAARREALLRKQSWGAAGNARLNRLADLVMRVDEPGGTPRERVRVAKAYVLLLRDFETATTGTDRAAVEESLAALEWEVGINPAAREREVGSAPRPRWVPVSVERMRARIAAREKAVAERRDATWRSTDQKALRRAAAQQRHAAKQRREDERQAQRAETQRREAKARRRRRNKRQRKR
ncbi:MAG: hypothetical protein WBA97_26425 [Actinophytocola sp.]|uniref:hypothetical protein n=1 Tax=Actinophytocola sp. TaxID=1872138 RepID=UPI003C76EF6D